MKQVNITSSSFAFYFSDTCFGIFSNNGIIKFKCASTVFEALYIFNILFLLILELINFAYIDFYIIHHLNLQHQIFCKYNVFWPLLI